ncbi:MAG: trimethylamine methyltransferase family protein [Dehalococcoidia bacterium]|nr:trimethylamine methyltransferase family protein [Dehalococcoidia bacterium]
MTETIKFKLLTQDQVSSMYDKCVEFLSTHGILVENHPKSLEMFEKAGATVNHDSGMVRYSKDIIEKALSTAPSSFTLAGATEKHDLPLPHPDGLFYVRSVTGVYDILDPDTNTYRPTTIADVAHWAQLVQVLDNVDICLYPTPRDVPEATADVHGLRALLNNTTKHITIQPFSFDSIEYQMKLAQTVTGGAEALKKRPRISMISAPMVPFAMKAMDAEVIIQCSRAGVPISANPLPNMGGTSPATIAGTIVQNGIEILSVLVMSQLLCPGAKVIGQPNFYTMDMTTGRCLTANVESHLGAAASAQFIKDAFHIPTWTWGVSTDSYLPDGHSGIEKMLGGLLVAGVGCDILAGAGFLDAGKICSPVQLIIDDTMISILKRAMTGVKIDEDTLAWQEILDTVPLGHYLEREHTLRHCRDTLRTELFVSQSRDSWSAEGSKDLYARALDKYVELKKLLKPLDLSEGEKKEIDRIVSQADQRLVK